MGSLKTPQLSCPARAGRSSGAWKRSCSSSSSCYPCLRWCSSPSFVKNLIPNWDIHHFAKVTLTLTKECKSKQNKNKIKRHSYRRVPNHPVWQMSCKRSLCKVEDITLEMNSSVRPGGDSTSADVFYISVQTKTCLMVDCFDQSGPRVQIIFNSFFSSGLSGASKEISFLVLLLVSLSMLFRQRCRGDTKQTHSHEENEKTIERLLIKKHCPLLCAVTVVCVWLKCM